MPVDRCLLPCTPQPNNATMPIGQLVPALQEALAVLAPHSCHASAYVRRDTGTRVRTDNQGGVPLPMSPRAGFTLTAWRGGRIHEASCDDARPMTVAREARRLAKRLASCALPVEGPCPQPGEALERSFEHEMERDSREVPVDEKLELGRALREHLLGRGERLVEALTEVADVHADILYVDAQRQLRQRLHRVRQIALGVFADDAHQAQLHDGFERIGGWEHMQLEPDRWEALLRDGPRILGAPRIPDPGRHVCVFAPAFAGMFAHEAFGHGTEQDLFRKRRAKGAEYMGQQVASEMVDMFDDPSNGWAASYFFDDEGVLAHPTRIIDKGVLVAGLNDAQSAAALQASGIQVAKSANGRREAFDHKVYARMSNTFFGPGASDLEAMIASVEHGYLLRHPSNGMEDPQGWGIQLEGAYAERIAEGALTGEVFSPVVVTGFVPDLLRSISMVGSEVAECSLGMCGKGYKEWVKVTDGGPALRLEAVLA